jgi:hypothetical protein
LAKLAARRHGVFAANNDFPQRYPQKNAAARRRRRSKVNSHGTSDPGPAVRRSELAAARFFLKFKVHFGEGELTYDFVVIRSCGSLHRLKRARSDEAAPPIPGVPPMPRSFDDIARLDRRWFRVHPERRHRCRRPDSTELDLYDGSHGGRLIIAMRHLGRGRVLYQPLFLHGPLPSDERSAAALFILAASRPEPIPELAALDWQMRRFGTSARQIARAVAGSG